MTREEAYNRIDAIIAKYEIDDEYVTITNLKDYEALRMARKILEQEPILDKIRAEIKTKYDSIPWGNNDYDDGWVEALEWVFDDVIDKYIKEYTE